MTIKRKAHPTRPRADIAGPQGLIPRAPSATSSDSGNLLLQITSFDIAFSIRRGAMTTSEVIHGKVAQVLVEALGVDEDDVSPAATLQGDLGAESIDFLDIVFRLEREFEIKIPRGELFPDSIFEGRPEFVREGRVTDEGMAELRSRMPYSD